jgi:hypothetical protein
MTGASALASTRAPTLDSAFALAFASTFVVGQRDLAWHFGLGGLRCRGLAAGGEPGQRRRQHERHDEQL